MKAKVNFLGVPYSKYLVTFAWMLLFTAASFVLITYQIFSPTKLFCLITIFAAIQVILQLVTFMHLDQKGQSTIIVFMASGLFIALVSALGIILL